MRRARSHQFLGVVAILVDDHRTLGACKKVVSGREPSGHGSRLCAARLPLPFPECFAMRAVLLALVLVAWSGTAVAENRPITFEVLCGGDPVVGARVRIGSTANGCGTIIPVAGSVLGLTDGNGKVGPIDFSCFDVAGTGSSGCMWTVTATKDLPGGGTFRASTIVRLSCFSGLSLPRTYAMNCGSAQGVPTLPQWGIGLLVLALGALGMVVARNRATAA